jgi:hypothetical protein
MDQLNLATYLVIYYLNFFFFKKKKKKKKNRGGHGAKGGRNHPKTHILSAIAALEGWNTSQNTYSVQQDVLKTLKLAEEKELNILKTISMFRGKKESGF